MAYRELDETNILTTVERLKARISERFPGSGLSKVADELIRIGNEVHETVAYLGAPDYAVRIPVTIAIVLIVVLAGVAMGITSRSLEQPGWGTIESGISNIVPPCSLAGISIIAASFCR